MNHLKLIMATVALTGLSVTAEATQQVKIEEHHPIVTKTKEPGWANVNCITLQDEFSTTIFRNHEISGGKNGTSQSQCQLFRR